MDERTFPRTFASLADIFTFTAGFFGREAIDQAARLAVDFAIEELFTNMVKYNPANPHGIRIGLQRKDDQVEVRLTDFHMEPFDPTEAPEADVSSSVQDRPIGKLGLHLLKEMVDDVGYQHQGGQSTITLIKRLG